MPGTEGVLTGEPGPRANPGGGFQGFYRNPKMDDDILTARWIGPAEVPRFIERHGKGAR